MCADLRVRVLRGESGDLCFLGRELTAGLGRGLSRRLAGGQQFAAGSLGESLGALRAEQVVSGSQLLACVEAAAFAA